MMIPWIGRDWDSEQDIRTSYGLPSLSFPTDHPFPRFPQPANIILLTLPSLRSIMSVNCSFVHIGVAIGGGVNEAALASASSPLLLSPLRPLFSSTPCVSLTSASHRWLCTATGDVGKESLRGLPKRFLAVLARSSKSWTLNSRPYCRNTWCLKKSMSYDLGKNMWRGLKK